MSNELNSPPWQRITYLTAQIARLELMHQAASSFLSATVATSDTLAYVTALQGHLDALKHERAIEINKAGVVGAIHV